MYPTGSQRVLWLVATTAVVSGIALVIRVTGGMPSQLTHLYFVPIVVGAIVLPPRLSFTIVLLAALAVTPAIDGVNALLGASHYFSDPVSSIFQPGGWAVRPAALLSVWFVGTVLARELLRQRSANVDLEEALEQERERATRDSLTGVLNHVAVLDALRDALARADGQSPVAVAVTDVDGLRAINDTYGHEVGDGVLCTVARALARNGAVVGRYGADEFVTILVGEDRERAESYRDETIERLRASPLRHPQTDHAVPVLVTIGLAVAPEEANTAEDLIRLADNAMYANRRGRPGSSHAGGARFDSERAAKLINEVVRLVTSPGTREDKLRLVAHHIALSGGYDAVNIEVTGENLGQSAEWERAFVRAPKHLVDAWMHELKEAQDHPLGRLLQKTRQPLFINDLATDERLTPAEREIVAAAGLRTALVVPMIWQERVVGMLSVANKTRTPFRAWDADFLSAIASHVTAIVFMTSLVEELQQARDNLVEANAETVMMLAAAAEAYDDTTGRHLQRVRKLAEALAGELGYTPTQSREIGLAAVLHDVGKVRVPHAVLTSPDSLGPDEWSLMMQHTLWGAEFLSGRRGFELAAVVARSHHERWDGTGYPHRLKGEDIPEAAAITAVADAFDAMTNDRPYRSGRSPEEALEEIRANAGTQFSPRVVDALERLYSRAELPFLESPEEPSRVAA